MRKGYMSVNGAKELLMSLDASVSAADYENLVADVNASIQGDGFELRTMKSLV